MSLGRLWQQQGKRDRGPAAAGRGLWLVYRGISRPADLQEAQALLEVLA